MKAITTKFHGPSNVKGSRYSASDEDGNRVILSSDHSLNSDANHARAAQALLDKMEWAGRMVGGGTKNGMVWVFVDNSPSIGTTTRYERAFEILEDTTALENGFEIPTNPKRYLSVEMNCDAVVWAYNDDTLERAASSLENSDTSREFELVHDLDTGNVLRPIMKVTSWYPWRTTEGEDDGNS